MKTGNGQRGGRLFFSFGRGKQRLRVRNSKACNMQGASLGKRRHWPVTSERIGALPSINPLFDMIRIDIREKTSEIKDFAGTPAANSYTCDREEAATRVNRNANDEDTCLNLRGRQMSDNSVLKTRCMLLKIATWNVRTLFQAGKFDNVCQEMDRMRLDVLGISETRWTDNGKIVDNEKVMVYAGGEEHRYGVGIMMKKSIANCMLGYWPVSERIIMLKLQAKPFNINIIQVYAPTQDHPDDTVEMFYDEIRSVLKYAKSGEVTIIMGDMNAKVGKEEEYPTTGKYGLGKKNERGMMLVEFCKGEDLVITNTMFKHHVKNLYTWKSPGDLHRNQIDYIMINQRFKNNVKNVKTYPGADVGSDHNPVVMSVKVKLKRKKVQPQVVKYDMKMLKQDEVRRKYNIEIRNRFELLFRDETDMDDETRWNSIKETLNEALKTTVPVQAKKARQKWMTDEILNLMNERREKKRKTEEYKEIDKKIKSMCKKAKIEWWDTKCKDIERLEKEYKTKEMHDRIKDVTGKDKHQRGNELIRDKDGNMLFDEEAIQGRWEEYVQELYDDERGDMPTIPDEEDGEEILISEVEKTIKDLKIEKAPGMDQITTEMIKALDEYPVKVLTEFCNRIYDNGKTPGDMNASIIRKMPKKTKATKCEEHRTLSLMSHVLKLMLKIILRRNKFLEEEISDAQSGFINGKGTREGIFNLHTISERYTDLNRDVFACFIDYEKAFDKVNHKKMVECLINVGMRGKDIRFIRNLYWEQKAFIKLENSLSKEINIKRCETRLRLEPIFVQFIHGINIQKYR